MTDDVDPKQLAALMDLKKGMEGDLHADLKPYMGISPMGMLAIKHPLLINILAIPGMHGHDNRVYLKRKEQLVEARAAKNWGQYVFTHERPWRADALAELIGDGSLTLERKADWKLVKEVWTDSENVEESDDFWSYVWAHENAGMSMDAKERAALDALPDPVPVWHGLERRDAKTLGFSWTSSEGIAQWFAGRFAMQHRRPAYIAKGFVPKHQVRTYIMSRSEFEVIAFPKRVDGVKISRAVIAKAEHPVRASRG